jgi:hypothetical protein
MARGNENDYHLDCVLMRMIIIQAHARRAGEGGRHSLKLQTTRHPNKLSTARYKVIHKRSTEAYTAYPQPTLGASIQE